MDQDPIYQDIPLDERHAFGLSLQGNREPVFVVHTRYDREASEATGEPGHRTRVDRICDAWAGVVISRSPKRVVVEYIVKGATWHREFWVDYRTDWRYKSTKEKGLLSDNDQGSANRYIYPITAAVQQVANETAAYEAQQKEKARIRSNVLSEGRRYMETGESEATDLGITIIEGWLRDIVFLHDNPYEVVQGFLIKGLEAELFKSSDSKTFVERIIKHPETFHYDEGSNDEEEG